MNQRKITHGSLKFPHHWIELNPQCAKQSKSVAICVDGSRVGVYYTNNDVSNLTMSEKLKMDTYADIFGFDKNYCIYGLVEQAVIDNTSITNVGNAELIKE